MRYCFFTIFTNEQLAQVAGKRPTSKVALQKIPGIGEAKTNKYGQAVIGMVATITKQQKGNDSIYFLIDYFAKLLLFGR